MKTILIIYSLGISFIAVDAVEAQSPSPSAKREAVPVTADNFNRAESDMYFAGRVKESGIGKLFHNREMMPIDKQSVVRVNRDTLYSTGVFDLDAGPMTVTLPDPGKRFMSIQVFDEDQYSPGTFYAPKTLTFSKEKIGTRYMIIGIRTFVDPKDPKDIEKVHALQDAVKVEQKSPGTFEIPNWDLVSQKKVRDALIVLAGTIPDTVNMFGPKDKVDPVRHLIGTATGWGGNAPKDATYLTVVPKKNDGQTVHKLTIKGEVPVDGFWSITVYGADGYLHKNDQDSYSFNNVTAKKDADGSVTIQFGGCDGAAINCIPVTADWNYWVRLYRPRKEILDGTWKFPEAQPVP
jgi:hypothetical protein